VNTTENREYTPEIMFESFSVPDLYISVLLLHPAFETNRRMDIGKTVEMVSLWLKGM
jgi:actin-related protein